jgi:YbbR domain-containing protein
MDATSAARASRSLDSAGQKVKADITPKRTEMAIKVEKVRMKKI